MTKLFALVDCNNFYCSCERVFDPKLERQPVAVLSNNDGCIVARSNEVKAMGIPMGAPYFRYKEELTKAGAVVFSSNYQLYGDMSHRVMQTLREFSPDMEVYSIDEAFLGLDGFGSRNLMDYAATIRQTVKQWTGIPVSIGIAPTKTLAKVANHIAKKHTSIGVFDLSQVDNIDAVLERFPVGDIWGVGRKWKNRLQCFGITNAKQLRDVDAKWMRQHFSVVGERIVQELRGISCLDLEDVQSRKNILSSRSFGIRVTAKAHLSEALSNYAARACEKLRAQKSKVQSIYVFIRTNHFRVQDAQYANSMTLGFDTPTSDTTRIIKVANQCLEKLFKPGYAYQKAGIMLLDLIPEDQCQFDLFAEPEDPKRKILMAYLDHMNQTMGKDAVQFASQGVERPWVIKSDLRSPRYTTQWGELPQAH